VGRRAGRRVGHFEAAHPKKLILAAADAAEEQGNPPPLLRKAWLCEKWGTLPRAGGLDDQDAAEFLTMNTLHHVYQVMHAAYKAESLAKWAEQHYQDYKTWVLVDELRRADDG
jgi:hypothetical protein